MAENNLQHLYDKKYAHYKWKMPVLRPNAVSTTRHDDTARMIGCVSSDASLLDIGCGAGELTLALANRFARCVGVDISPVRIEQAKKVTQQQFPELSSKVEFIAQNAENELPFPAETFDVVVACAVLEHAVDVFGFVDEMHRVCRSDGFVILTVPNLCYIKNVRDILLGRLPLTGIHNRDMEEWRKNGWDGGHLHYFSRASLGKLLVHCGFRPVKWTGSGKFAKLRRWCTNLVGDLTVKARKR